jgi:hypothetical protein
VCRAREYRVQGEAVQGVDGRSHWCKGCRGARALGCKGVGVQRAPGCEGARVHGVPGCQGAGVQGRRGAKGARARGCPGAVWGRGGYLRSLYMPSTARSMDPSGPRSARLHPHTFKHVMLLMHRM